jgi:hypothetical protein
MAEVFAAEDVRLGRTVAVKLLRTDLAEDPVSKARFTREAQSVAGLNHHAVVAVYDSGEDEVASHTVPYIVMELVEGRTIRELLQGAEAPPPDEALAIVSGVLEALSYSHHHGIVHRDIKPANVIITSVGAVKVMDFGIARALHGAQSTMTQTGMVMGTPQYLSPEQALGRAVDHRSDLYATGCLLYELLTQRPPFTGETPLSVVYQHVQDDPVPPSEVTRAVPPELDGLVMRSLAKDPDDRFQSADEMRALVQYALQMLQEKGGHTGVWDTGAVTHTGGSTPAMGVAGAGARSHPHHGDTSRMSGGAPLLPGRREDDSGFDGHGPGGSSGSGGGRGRMWLVAILAVIAVVVGVAAALDNADGNGGGTKVTPTTADPGKDRQQPPSTAGAETTEGTEPSDGAGGTDDYMPPSVSSTPTWTPSATSSVTAPTSAPTESPADGATTGGTGGATTEPSGGTGGTDGGGPGTTGDASLPSVGG